MNEITKSLIKKLDDPNLLPLERFNIKMYLGLQEDPNIIRNISDEDKWLDDLINKKLKNE